MRILSMVTGANGLLGNTLVRELIGLGYEVRASVRDINNKKPFEGLTCDIVYADILDKESLVKAMQGVETLYHVAAVFKHWSEDPQREIIEANINGTRNIIEAAAQAGVKKIVYVSSIATLDFSKDPIDESTWGCEFPNPYAKSKSDAEKVAWELAKELDVWMVSVLPSSIIGSNIYASLNPIMGLLNMIVKNQLPFDPNFYFSFVNARDVARGMILAAQKGINGERYTLATDRSMTTTQVIDLARLLFPEIKKPDILTKDALLILAKKMEEQSKITHTAPMLLSGNVELYSKEITLDISKAKNELGYHPTSPEDAIKEALLQLTKVNC